MRRLLSLILVLMLAISLLGGCSTSTPAEESSTDNQGTATEESTEKATLKIGASISDFDDVWLMYMKDAMEAQLASYDNVEFQFTDGKSDPAKQLEQIENFIVQGYDAVIINPVNTSATEPMTNACLEAGVKVIYVNRIPDYLPEGSYYVGSDSLKAGIMQMEYLAEQLNEEGNVVIMQGALESEATYNRTDGVKEIVGQYDGMEVTKEQTANFNRAEGKTLMENWIASGDQIDAVAANNDEMAIGAIMALEDAGMLDKVLVGGIDATPEALQQIDQGKLDVTVFQDAAGQGAGAAEAAVTVLEGETIEQKVWVPWQLVTPENYKDFMN